MRIVAVLLVAFFFAPQGKKNAADVCPWCKNDPKLLASSGVITHGPIAIGADGSEKLAALCAASKWIFAETAHLRFGSSLGDQTVELADRERVERDLAHLRERLPTVPVKPKKLDPWLRLHLLALKSEEFYERFQRLLHVGDSDFFDTRQPNGPYVGDGKFLGEKDKYEVVLHSSHENHVRFTENISGVVVQGSFRWHVQGPLHKMLVSVPCIDDLREDRWLTAHVVHNLSHLFFCGYKSFTYDPPIWLDEALALAMEKEVEPKFRTIEGEEGTFRDNKGPSDFEAEARKLVATSKQLRFAELLQAKNFAELGDPGAVTAWSMARFLIDQHGENFAKFLGLVKGQLDAAGYPTGQDLQGPQRKALKDLWNWTPAELDTAWSTWVAAQAAPDDTKKR